MPHRFVIQMLSNLGVGGKSLNWFSSSLSDRTFYVKVDSSYSITADVSSGVIEGSVLRLSLYTIFINPLLNSVHLPAEAFADDLKFIADTTEHDKVYIQTENDIVADFSSFHQAPLSIDKCVVLHCGRQCVPNPYTIYGVSIKSVECFADLGVWSANGTYARHYSDMIAKSSRTSGLIGRIFHQRSRSLMWLAFQTYFLSKLMYCSPVWAPYFQRDIVSIEAVQRRYTKSIYGLENISYADRLRELRALSLQNKCLFADLILVYKCIHQLMCCSADDLGLRLMASNTRVANIKLHQQHFTNILKASLFSNRAAREWNRIPIAILQSKSVSTFKQNLFSYLFERQSDDT